MMHELGLTRNIVAIVDGHARGQRVKRIQLVIGPLACVERQALTFCFQIVTEGTSLEEAALEFVEGEADIFRIREYELMN